MAFDLLDEHEQGERVRQWLRENALSMVVGIALGLLLIFGWQQWKVHRARHDAEAAAQYQAMLSALAGKHNDDATRMAQALRENYANTSYAVFAAMREADLAAAKPDLAAAAADLEWAVAHAGLPALKDLAELRLARVELASGKAKEALQRVDAIPKGNYVASVEELRGDALAALGRFGEARQAYAASLATPDIEGAESTPRKFVQMKLDNLPPAPEKQGS